MRTDRESDLRRFRILGVEIVDATMDVAVGLLSDWMAETGRPRRLYFVNAHTLNQATDREYRDVLNSADAVFGDGTGVRWAARLQGIEVRDNLNGTDLVPALLAHPRSKGLRYYLLGADADSIERAVAHCRARFRNCELVGHHHGYIFDGGMDEALSDIRDASPQLLLVGMGNPKQERFLYEQRDEIDVPLSVGVGGLFDHWAGNLERAPGWVRRLGFEWVQLLLQQPHKARRYLLGNPLYLYRVGRERVRETMR